MILCAPMDCVSHPMKKFSTSPIPGPLMDWEVPHIFALLMWKMDTSKQSYLCRHGPGFADGIRCDIDGNLWSSSGWGNPKITASKFSRPMATSLAKFTCPKCAPTSALADKRKPPLHDRRHVFVLSVRRSQRRAKAVISSKKKEI